jgi:hypothetical protein
MLISSLACAVVIPSDDPLYREKRARLAELDLSTQQTFQLSAVDVSPLPPLLLPYLRLCYASTQEELWAVQFGDQAGPVSTANEAKALGHLGSHLGRRLKGYRRSVEEDDAIIADPSTGPRQAVAARLLRIEKRILQRAVAQLLRLPGAADAVAGWISSDAAGVKLV